MASFGRTSLRVPDRISAGFHDAGSALWAHDSICQLAERALDARPVIVRKAGGRTTILGIRHEGEKNVSANADSMATWFTGVFDALAGVLFDIRIEDQDHSARLLREGVVMGAVTTERTPVLADGSFVRVSDAHLDVGLFWQCWKLDSPMVGVITDAVASAAAKVMV